MGGEVVEAEPAHGGAGLDGGAADMGEKDGAGVVEESGRHTGFVLKDIEADILDEAGLESVDEGGFVHDAAAGDIDEGAGGAEGGEHGGVNEVVGGGPTGAGEDEKIGGGGEADEGGMVGVRDGLGLAAVVGDGKTEGGEAGGDGLADAAEAEDSGGLATERGGERELGLEPGVLVEEAICLDEAAAGHEDEGGGEVGDVVGEDAGGVGEADAAGMAGGDVHAIVTDAAEGDDLEIGEAVEEGSGDLGAAIADEGTDGGSGGGEVEIKAGRGIGGEAVEGLLEEGLDGWREGGENEGNGVVHRKGA
jgi:hypothetical protein